MKVRCPTFRHPLFSMLSSILLLRAGADWLAVPRPPSEGDPERGGCAHVRRAGPCNSAPVALVRARRVSSAGRQLLGL